MTPEEAKNILSLCRPGNDDDRNDPLIAEALDLMETDLELSAWFEAEQAADAAICAEFEKIEVPGDLKASILAGMRAHEANKAANPLIVEGDETDSDENIIEFTGQKKKSWINPWMGIAAVFAVLFGISVVMQQSNQSSGADQLAHAEAQVPEVINFLASEIDSFKIWDFDKRDNKFGSLKAHLVSAGNPAPDSIPEFAESLPTLGCVAFDYKGGKLSMICFKDGEVYHLITADKSIIGKELPTDPQTFEIRDQAFKSWQDDKKVYILGVEGTKADIPEFI